MIDSIMALLKLSTYIIATLGPTVDHPLWSLYPMTIPQDARYPAIAVQTISDVDPSIPLDGVATYAQARIQLSIWAPSKAVCEALRIACKYALIGVRGDVLSGHDLKISYVTTKDDYEPGARYYKMYSDYLVGYNDGVTS